ncbi:LexA family transcriptional regulator [Pseudomonas lactis]|uniref:Helix-turn-helix domain-containing protein n=1 Tax=Pseudomonas lactis TaxID=1615674 RepID=A0A7Y1QK81_9PSED|nr:S24 family peptidase [Pseudomonas lactis]KRP69350.1 transcriptional regulator [Pseudomonas lactis]NNA77032.1 helix-turn-helix domain-containing protein [Pseudomonas lactis]NNA83103.1 helix-turn-helix domain-containing protein [Pseudomonas lactis]
MKKWYELAKARMKELDITQDQVAEQMGVTQGAVAHWLGGRREPSLEKVGSLLDYLGLPPMFPKNGSAPPAARVVEANAELIGDMAVWSDGDPVEDDECEVPYYAEVEFAGGDGMTEVMEVADRTLRFSNATLRAAGVECENAAVARVRGNSMEKLILDGAAIGFDLADTSVIDGEIYAFNHGGMLRVKYLYRLPAGAIRIRSENADEFPDEIMTSEQYRDEIKMLGRVFWWSTVRRSPKKK